MTHVVLASDSGYLDYVAASIRQVSQHAPTCDGIVLVVPPGVDAADLTTVERIGTYFGTPVEVVELPALSALERSKAIASRDHVSTFTYSKLFMAEAMPHHDQVLYIDVDTLVRDSLDELLAWRLHHPIGAVHELGSNGARIFGSNRVSYFNAGVLRMSLARLRQEDVASAAVEVLRANPRLPFQDQDVLNLLFRDRHDVLPLAYNVFDSVAEVSLPSWKVLRDPTIVHFVGSVKPWHEEAVSPYAHEWRQSHVSAVGMKAGARAPRQAPPVEEPDATTAERAPRRSLSERIAVARRSPLGHTLRRSVPRPLRHALNMTAITLIPSRSPVRKEVIRGMNAPIDLLPEAEAEATEAPVAPEAMAQAAMLPVQEEPATQTAAKGDLVLICSLPRSGTNALISLLTRGVLDLHNQGEFYYGQVFEQARTRLEPDFPWIGDADFKARAQMTPDEQDASRQQYRDTMSAKAADVTAALMRGTEGPTVIKVFPGHLDPLALSDVMREFRPRVIILRRTLLFSYISFIKAKKANAWYRRDITNAAVRMSDDEVADYVRLADGWFREVEDLCDEHGLETLRITYEGLLEGGQDTQGLRDLLADCTFSPAIAVAGSWEPTTVKQDRRTDGSLARSMTQFSHLTAKSQATLLRHPWQPRSKATAPIAAVPVSQA